MKNDRGTRAHATRVTLRSASAAVSLAVANASEFTQRWKPWT